MTRAAALLSAIFVAFSLASHSAAAQAPQKQLTVEAIFAHGRLVPKTPETLAWSPDGKHLTYLEAGQLMDVDPVTGKVHVMVSAAKMDSLSGSDGSEQDRDHRDRYNMAGYLSAPNCTHLLFDANGRLWLYDLRNGTGVQIGFTGAASGRRRPQVLARRFLRFLHSRARPFHRPSSRPRHARRRRRARAQPRKQ